MRPQRTRNVIGLTETGQEHSKVLRNLGSQAVSKSILEESAEWYVSKFHWSIPINDSLSENYGNYGTQARLSRRQPIRTIRK